MKRVFVLIILIAYITIGGFGFMHAYQMLGHDHMDMTPCPFMQGHEAICTMNASEHLTAWQTAFTTILSNHYLLLSLFALSLWGLFSYIVWRPPDRNKLRFIIFNRNKRIPTLYETLYSKGILNPKAP